MSRSRIIGSEKLPRSAWHLSHPADRLQTWLTREISTVFQKMFGRPRVRALARLRGYRPQCEQLECRQLLSAATPLSVNVPITTDPGVQQMPSVAADPHDPQHLVVAYMDYSLVDTGYAGLGAKVSHDGGATWQPAVVQLPAGFDQGADAPIVHFD